jgi:hypothetical protein
MTRRFPVACRWRAEPSRIDVRELVPQRLQTLAHGERGRHVAQLLEEIRERLGAGDGRRELGHRTCASISSCK